MGKHRHSAPRRDNVHRLNDAEWRDVAASIAPPVTDAPYRLVSQRAVKRLAFGCLIVGAIIGSLATVLFIALFP